MRESDKALMLARRILEQNNDVDSDLVILARSVLQFHSGKQVAENAMVQALSLQTHYARLLTGSPSAHVASPLPRAEECP